MSYVKQSIDFGFRHVAQILSKSGLDRVPPDPVVLCEKVVEQAAVLRAKR